MSYLVILASYRVEKGLRGIYMARYFMVAAIYHHGTVSKTDTWFLDESELDSFSKWLKMSYFGGNMPLDRVEKGWRSICMARHLMVATTFHHGTVSKADTWCWAE